MIDNVAQTMKKLENIVIDCCSDSDKSDQLSERQKTRLDFLKQKRKERKYKVAKNNVIEDRKRGPDANVQANSVETRKIKIFDNELWFSHAIKAVDSEIDKKRNIENEQVSIIATKGAMSVIRK